MDISIQLFTGGCNTPAKLDTALIIGKIRRILRKTSIKSAFIGWNKDSDVSGIVQFLRESGADVYLWLPVFSELGDLADFSPLVGPAGEKVEIHYDMGVSENFLFYCPSSAAEKVIEVYEQYYNDDIYDGVFLDKIRYPSFIGGANSIFNCFCDTCMASLGKASFDLPNPDRLLDADSFNQSSVVNCGDLCFLDSINPLGIVKYKDLRYQLNSGFQTLFDHKCDAVFRALEHICTYFRLKEKKIGFDLFAPFLAYFVGQDYHRLLGLADIVKPMFYGITNAPAGIPFEIDMYAKAFDDYTGNARERKVFFEDCVGYGDDIISREIRDIKRVIERNKFHTLLYAGIELNYVKDVAPVTKEYILNSLSKISDADGLVASWDLASIPDAHIDCLLGAIE